MAMKVRSAKRAAKKWAARTPLAAERYRQGVLGPRAGAPPSEDAADEAAYNFGRSILPALRKYEKAFAPYREVLAKLKLPRRYPLGDPRNINRWLAVALALRQEKLRRTEPTCARCGQPMTPKGVRKKPGEYDHAQGCPNSKPRRRRKA